MKAGAVRIRHARIIVAAGAAIVALAILLLSRNFNFYFDEWDFILAAPDLTWLSFLQPHNEHPVVIPKLIYAALLNTVGLRAYWPYMGVLLALHATNAFLLTLAENVPHCGRNSLITSALTLWENKQVRKNDRVAEHRLGCANP